MFQVPNFDPKDAGNRFSFEVPRRRWWHWRTTFSVPRLHFVPLFLIREAAKADKPLQMYEVCTRLGERAAARAVARLNQPEIASLEKAWLDDSAVGLGELAASSDS